jgi:SAM-dependent methyltransferase
MSMLVNETRATAWDDAYRKQRSGSPDDGVPVALWQEAPIPYLQDIELNRQMRNLNIVRILDAGCGDGRNSFWLERHGFYVVAADISRTALEIASRRAERDCHNRVVFIQEDIANLRLIGPFDCVLCADTLGQLEKPETAIAEFHRVLRPGGVFLFNLYTPNDGTFGVGTRLTELSFEYKGTLFRYFTEDMARGLVQDWADVRISIASWMDPPHGEFRPVPHMHDSWIVSARKPE